MIEPVQLSYDLHLLPTGRVPFRRWRWELWHGPRLLAAGWRVNVLHAQRALRVYAVRHAHRIHGLHPLRPEAAQAPEREWGGAPVAIESGELRVVLSPRMLLDGPPSAAATTI
jgi:hypothetical protein